MPPMKLQREPEVTPGEYMEQNAETRNPAVAEIANRTELEILGAKIIFKKSFSFNYDDSNIT